MNLFSSEKLYENVFDNINENVESMRIKITLQNGESFEMTIDGRLNNILKIKSPLDQEYYNKSYEVMTAREVLHDFLDSRQEYMVSEEDEYFNITENKVRKIKILIISPKQVTIKIFAGVFEVGAKNE